MDDSESILTSIKKLLGVGKDYTIFDQDIVMYINSVFLNLSQLGIGPKEGFSISSEEDKWSDLDSTGHVLNAVKAYIYLKVRLLFDPPTSTAATEAINRMIGEAEWRINVEAENKHIKEND